MPWQDNPEWDEAIAESDEIGIGGDRTDDGRRSTEFLYRPEQLICDAAVWSDPRDPGEQQLRARLTDANARETRTEPLRAGDDQRAAAADNLGLKLLNVPGAELLDLVRDARRLVPDALAFNQVLIADPQRWGGGAPPHLLSQPTVQIPGATGPQQQREAKTIAVLDTGIVQNAPFPVEQNPDIEQGGAGSPAEAHGTMVAAVLARFAPSARLLIKGVLKMPLGDADELEIAAALDALRALPTMPDIINASFSGPAADDARMVALERAVNALPASTLVVAAAGNEGLERPFYMAAFKRVIGVASAGDVGGQNAVYDYSNRGHWVDASTQGTDVETLAGANKPVLATGSSFAAPKIVAEIVRIAERDDVGVRHAASWLINQSGGPAIAGGGTFVDMPTP